MVRKPWIFGTAAVAEGTLQGAQEAQETGMEMRTCLPNKEQAGVSLSTVLVIP